MNRKERAPRYFPIRLYRIYRTDLDKSSIQSLNNPHSKKSNTAGSSWADNSSAASPEPEEAAQPIGNPAHVSPLHKQQMNIMNDMLLYGIQVGDKIHFLHKFKFLANTMPVYIHAGR